MKRHQQILLGVLALQIILCGIAFWPRQAASSGGVLVFPDLKSEDVVDFRLTDNQGITIHLSKTDSGWVIPEAGDYPVSSDKLTPVLDDLVALATGDLVARTAASHKQLQVADDAFVRRLEFSTADGASHTLYLGSAPRYTATHFRVDGQAETYLTTDLATWELVANQSSWIDTSYLAIDEASVSKLTLENANGVFTFSKGADGTWTLEGLRAGETASAGNIGAVVRNATTMSIQSILGKTDEPAFGLSAPLAAVTLELQDGSVKVLLVGARNAADTTYTVKFSDSEYYASAYEYLVKPMVENAREDFIAPIGPTPTATP